MSAPQTLFLFKTTTLHGKPHVKEPVKLAPDALALLAKSPRRAIIYGTGPTGAGKSTLLDSLVRGPDLTPQSDLSEPFLADEGHEGSTRAVHMYGPVPLAEFSRRWHLAEPDDEIDLFFVDTEGTDSADSDSVAMSVLPVLGSIADVRLYVMCRRPPASGIPNLLNGIKAAAFLSSVRSTAVGVVVRQCGPAGCKPDHPDRHSKRVAQDQAFTLELRRAAEQAELSHPFEADQSRFRAFCQPCWVTDPNEHRSSMTDLAQFVVVQALATQPVSIGWVALTVENVSRAISHRTDGRGFLNETEIWNSLLGKACDDAEQEVTTKYCREALSKVSALQDLDAALRFDVVTNRDEMFNEARHEFRSKCTDRRADLLTLIPDLIEAAEHNLRETIEAELQRYLSELLCILTREKEALQAVEEEVEASINELTAEQVPVFNLVGCRHRISGRLTATFAWQVQQAAEAQHDFADRIAECTRRICEAVEERLYLRHKEKEHAGLSIYVQAVFREMFPVGTILISLNSEKPAWMGADWRRLGEGVVLVSGGDASGRFPPGAEGGSEEHRHDTEPHVLTIMEIPSHVHEGNGNVWYAVGYSCTSPWGRGVANYSLSAHTTGASGGGQGHVHGPTTASSSYPPYKCACFWERVAQPSA
jgi:hypothetical protein